MTSRPGWSQAALLGVLSISGAAALGVEVVEARILHRILGSTSASVAIVVAGFLGGLGLGSWLAGRRVASVARPLRAYAACELAAVASTFLFPALAGTFGEALLLPGGEVVLVLLVAGFSTPWGAMFPLIVEALRRGATGEALAARVRRAYGVNAIGSAAGGVLVGLAAIPAFGEWGALGLCAALELGAAAGAMALSRGAGAPAPSPGPGLACDAASRAAPRPAAWAFLFVSGLVAIYWEVLWTRLLVLVVGATSYSFSAIAGSVVLGIGLGSLVAVGPRLARRAGWLLPAIAAVVAAGLYLAVPELPRAYLAGVRSLGLPPLAAGTLGAAAVVLVPNLLLGGLVPWAIAPRAAVAGRGYALNCAGSAAGAFLGGPVAASALALEDAYRAGIAGLALLAVLGACVPAGGEAPADGGAAPGARRGRGAVAIALAASIAGLVFAGLRLGLGPWDPRALLSGVYQWSIEDLRTLPFESMLRAREILAIERGREVVVTVELDREASTVYVRGNGKVEGSVPANPDAPSLADLPTQLLLGAAPGWFAPGGPPRSTLLIGLGSGVTLGAVLRASGHGGFEGASPAEGAAAPGAVDAIEIEEAFLGALRRPEARPYLAPFLPAWMLGPDAAAGPGSDAPGRGAFRMHIGDARRLLAYELRGRTWDAIVSQPSEPWNPGSASLFTVEFFRLASRRLSEGGVFVQWLQLYKLDLEEVRLVVRTFRGVFPETMLLLPPRTGELLLVGTFRRAELEGLLRAPVPDWLIPAGVQVPADRLAIVVAGPAAVDRWVGLSPDLPVATDARGDLALRAARSLYSPREVAGRNVEALRALGATDPITRYLRLAPRDRGAVGRLLAARNARLGDIAEALAILEGDPSEEAGRLREQLRAR